MEDLRKVSSSQLYTFWKNLSIGLLVLVGLFVFSEMLPFYFSPIIALIGSATLYTILYNNRLSRLFSCSVVIYAIFFCLIVYSFTTILLNVLHIWGFVTLPQEFTFFSKPYIPALILDPICFLTLLFIYIRQGKLSICVDCKLTIGDPNERGKLGSILNHESHIQLKNLVILFGILSAVIWIYYLVFYVNTDINARDWYIFLWLNIIAFILDEIYFIFRYYNLYLDLKENNEIITPEELRDMTAKTYLRFYVICGEYVYVNTKIADPKTPYRQVIDTPFFTKRTVNGITIPEVNNIIRKMTGVKDGELRFFFGRRIQDMDRHSLLRYFYYLDGKPEDYPELNVQGVWMPFDEIKKIYSYNPGNMAQIWVSDLTRLATIILTQKIFDERGFRKNKLKSYRPSFTLREIRESDIDFQDDKWIRISLFNSDTRLYRLKRWLRSFSGKKNKKVNQWG